MKLVREICHRLFSLSFTRTPTSVADQTRFVPLISSFNVCRLSPFDMAANDRAELMRNAVAFLTDAQVCSAFYITHLYSVTSALLFNRASHLL